MDDTMAPSPNTAAHLVGSVPLGSAEEVFRAVAGTLGSRVRRIPDGETAERSGWVAFQAPLLMQHPMLELATRAQSGDSQSYSDETGEDHSVPVLALRDGTDPGQLRFDDLGYARAALDSYPMFARLKAEGVIGESARFQVCLPTPLAPVLAFIAVPDQPRVEPAYRAALLGELERICAAIPHDQLAVQWDVAVELAVLEGVWETGFDRLESEIPGRVAELGNAVPLPVDVGFHLCYGDLGHQHFVQPRDMSVLVSLAGEVLGRIERPAGWVHMPVPRDRDDDAYFAPLAGLSLPPGTELFLGLVHATDGIDGARRRAATARRFAPAPFGIATECGFGRREPEGVPALLDLHRVAADELAPAQP